MKISGEFFEKKKIREILRYEYHSCDGRQGDWGVCQGDWGVWRRTVATRTKRILTGEVPLVAIPVICGEDLPSLESYVIGLNQAVKPPVEERSPSGPWHHVSAVNTTNYGLYIHEDHPLLNELLAGTMTEMEAYTCANRSGCYIVIKGILFRKNLYLGIYFVRISNIYYLVESACIISNI
jgi:hypothetical protein